MQDADPGSKPAGSPVLCLLRRAAVKAAGKWTAEWFVSHRHGWQSVPQTRLLGREEVSIFPQIVRGMLPIRLISKEHSWHEGICGGLCFCLWHICPELSLDKLFLAWGACRDLCSGCGPLAAPHHCPAHRQLGSIQAGLQAL